MAVYALSDLHGHLDIYQKIKAFLQPEDIVYFLGDACDRGSNNWETVKTIYNDPQFIYLKGNHEDMLAKACSDYLKNGNCWDYRSYQLCLANGGYTTLTDWEYESERDKALWLFRLRKLPTWTIYINPSGQKFFLCHAGVTPWLDKTDTVMEIPKDFDLLWDRTHYLDDWDSKEMEDIIVIHGHTPNHHLAIDLNDDEWESGPLWYADGHKVDIDTGGFFSDEFCLLNLWTLESIIFEPDKKS